MSAIVPALLLVPTGAAVLAVRRRLRGYREALDIARHEAAHDGLTGLLTRTAFAGELARLLDTAASEPFALLAIDVDEFGQLNKLRGHAIGDELLVHLARTLVTVVRRDDVVGRLGGDEFAVLLRGGEDPVAVGGRLLAALRRHGINHRGVEVSIGIARAPRDGETVQALLRAADVAMRRAKRAGKGRVIAYAGESLADRSEKRARHALAETIAEDRIAMAVQPIVDLRGATIHAFEALARFDLPGDLSPAEVFALAERLGMREELDLACLARGLALLVDRPPGTRLTVNVSGTLLGDARTVALLDAQGSLDGLVLEITEEALVHDYDALRRAVAPLIERGVRIAVDDMGAGYSGLRHAIDVQPRYLKLDRALVQRIDRDPKRAALVDALLRYAQHAGSEIVAEGVETAGELATLTRLGVPLAQGYLLARPGPPWPSLAIALAPAGPAGSGCHEGRESVDIATIGAETTAEEAHRRFAADPALEALVVLDGSRRVIGLLTRHRLLARLGHRFGFALYGQRSVLAVADRHCLALAEATPWSELASRAMARDSDTRHDPIMLVDGRGRYVRHLTIRDLIGAAERPATPSAVAG